MTPEEVGLREQKKRQTQRELQRVALELVAAHGFDRVTIDDIAAAAAVSKTTFYRYFASKEDVLLGPGAERLEFLRAALEAQPEDVPAMGAVHDAVLEVARMYQHDRRQRLALATIMKVTPSVAARNLEHQAAWEDLLREYLFRRERGGAQSLRAWVLAADIVASLRAAVDYWLAHGATAELTEVVDEALQLLIDGQMGSRRRTTVAGSR